jgi:YaiO family outer membrane protein
MKRGIRSSTPIKSGLMLTMIFVLSFFTEFAHAQDVDTLKMSSDELFTLARQKAFAGKREDARTLCRTILARSPSYYDARILIGRTYSWDGRYEDARLQLRQVLEKQTDNGDAIDALLDVELWDGRYDQALDIASRALNAHPSNEEFLIRKAKALKGLGQEGEALRVLNILEDLNPSLAVIASLRQSLNTRSLLNELGLNYASDRFSGTYDPMHYAYLQLSRRTPLGSFFGRLNYSSRFEASGSQFEVDFYPRIADGVYAYLNYGYSQNDLFPRHRTGAEIYTKLPSSYEGSLGFRYLHFGTSSDVTIYTGSLGLYFGSYWISFRPYFIPNNAGLSKSASLTLRKYLSDAENFVSFRAGAGFSADERTIQSTTGFEGLNVFYLKSQTAGLGWQQSFSTNYLFVATFDVTNQELSFSPGNYVMMYSFSMGVRVRF